MTIAEDKVADAVSFAASVQPKIKAFEGCKHLDILQDVKQRNVIITYSLWDTENHLNLYRNSDLFKESWATVKKWFIDKPEARSLEVL
jgi:heme-degrading monooxygenase HmoA